MGPSRFELESQAPKARNEQQFLSVSKEELEQYLSIREIEGMSEGWMYDIERYLTYYLDALDWQIDYNDSLGYLKQLKRDTGRSYYRKQLYQIRRFLQYLDVGWAGKLNAPPELDYTPRRIARDDIEQTLAYFDGHKYFLQVKALVLLGASSGMRAEELYQLNPEDIDLEGRTINVVHDPDTGKTTKTEKSRVALFNDEARDALSEYMAFYNNGSDLTELFGKYHLIRLFREAPMYVKDLRKFFSQEWDRQGGPTTIKKILMGHSLKGDVDLNHYNAQSEEDLKRIYDNVDITVLP